MKWFLSTSHYPTKAGDGMKRRRLTVIWTPSASSKSSIFYLPSALIVSFICLSFITLAVLGIGGYLGDRLYRNYLQLKQENVHLQQKEKQFQQKEKQWDALRQAVERIRQDAKIVRSFLGLDKEEGEAGSLGQGGEPSPDLSAVDPKDAMLSADELFSVKPRTCSYLVMAQNLEENLQELLETMRDRRKLLRHTPSVIPVDTETYWLSSGFGWRSSPFTGRKEFHNGLDICGGKGTAIIAPANGVVVEKGRDKYLGNYIKIDHGSGILTIYGHLSKIDVRAKEKVNRGDAIGIMGSTGRSTGNHLHYIVKVNNKFMNPLHYIFNTKDNSLLLHPLLAKGGDQ